MARRKPENESVDLKAPELVSFRFSRRKQVPRLLFYSSVVECQLWKQQVCCLVKECLQDQYDVTPEPCQILRGRSDEPEPSCQSCLECVPSVPIVVMCPSYPEASRVSSNRFFSFLHLRSTTHSFHLLSFLPFRHVLGFLGALTPFLNKNVPKSNMSFPLSWTPPSWASSRTK